MKSSTLIFIILILIGSLKGVSSDIYAPSIPAISIDLVTSIDNVQWSMAIFMVGLALSQVFYGPLSEGIGRRIPLILGLLIFGIGSVLSFLAPSITVLTVGRFIQGFGAGAGATLWRTIFRDKYSGAMLAKYGAYLSICTTFVVPAAPTLGGYLQEYFQWRASFFFLILYSVLTLGVVFFFYEETNKEYHPEKLRLSYFRKSMKELLSSPIFMTYAFCAFLNYGAFFSWFVSGPVLLIDGVGMSPIDFGWITFWGGGGAMALASYVNSLLVVRLGIPIILRLGWAITLVAGLLMMGFKLMYGLTSLGIIVPIILFYFGISLTWSNIFAGAFTHFGHIAGYAGALYSFIQISGAAAMGGFLSYLPDTDQTPLALIYIFCSIIAWLLFETITAPEEKRLAEKI